MSDRTAEGKGAALAARLLLLSSGASLAVLACATAPRDDAPRHGWWDARGPVVPHDTFPADCALCHAGGTWSELVPGFSFDHAAETGVELEGAHAEAKCLRCHNDRGPVARFAARGCAGCHEDLHRGRLGALCERCHTQEDWRPAGVIQEHMATRFPLLGAHASTPCFACHPGAEVGQFDRAPVDCAACHLQLFFQAKDPDHVALDLPQTCESCHSVTDWGAARFPHTGITGGCVDCHLSDYQQTTKPDHQAAGFPTTCEACHFSTSTWKGASFDHSFPLTGPHGGLACSACHLQPSTFTSFSCTHCHAHSQREMDDEHDDVPGYVWESGACLACHPTGRE